MEDNTNLILKGIELSSQGRYEEAIQCYDQALAINPDDKEGWDGKGDALDDLGKHEEAIICYDYVLRIHPNDSTWAMKGIVLNKINRHQEANICFDKALAMNPQNTTAQNMKNTMNRMEQMNTASDAVTKGDELRSTKKFREAIPHYQKAIELFERDPLASDMVGNVSGCLSFCLFWDGRYTESIVYSDKAILVNPKLIMPWLKKSQSLRKLGKPDYALACVNKLLALDNVNGSNDTPIVWNEMGNVLFQLTRYDDAIRWYFKGMKKDPSESVFLVGIAECFDKLSKYDESISYYEKALEKDPSNEEIQKDLDSVKAKLSKDSPSKTVEKIEIIKKNEPSDPVIILKVRLAKGEITLEEYRKIKEHLEN